jgi:aryl-phospho-beta-D-glucosidase BglC (GH1 family)
MRALSFRRSTLALAVLLLGALAVPADDAWLPATPQKLPRWRGFNLLNMFMLGAGRKPFAEDDFRIIHDLGFNFVRLPMDYRFWIRNGDWTQIDEHQAFDDLDRVMAWAEKYHVHVCLNFHRAPGYTVAEPPEPRSLWTDPEAQRVCALHWAAFARHFKGIPAERLSFDLFNEPNGTDEATYARVVALMVDAIRREDPQRLIIADGLKWAERPCPSLAPLHIAQSVHCYQPMHVTHYRASWIGGSDTWPVPEWPLVTANAFLQGPDRPELNRPLTLTGNFPAGTRLDLVVRSVSRAGHLVVRADGGIVLDKTYTSGPQATEPGEQVVCVPEYQVYQNVFNQPLSVTLAQPAKKIEIGNEAGDWISLGSLSVTVNGATHALVLSQDWGEPPSTVGFDLSRPGEPWSNPDAIDAAWLWQHEIAPWQQLQSQRVGVMVGEWGCFNVTPDDVAMRWMEDNLANFQRAGFGWALWNLYGGFGLLDSHRPGAVYENYQGHQLDRRMLELLQKY